MSEVKLEDAPSRVRTYYDKGIAAMHRDNLDYAMDMFEAALLIEPQLLEIRKLLRVASIKKVKSNPPSKLLTVKNMAGLIRSITLLKKDPFQALRLTEILMRKDPFNPKFIKAYCDSATAAGLSEIAIQTLEILKENKPDKLFIQEPLAIFYKKLEHFDREYECRSAIARLKPNDTEALKKQKDAAARLTMEKASWQNLENR